MCIFYPIVVSSFFTQPYVIYTYFHNFYEECTEVGSTRLVVLNPFSYWMQWIWVSIECKGGKYRNRWPVGQLGPFINYGTREGEGIRLNWYRVFVLHVKEDRGSIKSQFLRCVIYERSPLSQVSYSREHSNGPQYFCSEWMTRPLMAFPK